MTTTLRAVTLDKAMARRLARAQKQLVDAGTERDALVVQAAEDGATLREIGEAVGLSWSGVRKILDRNR